MNEYEKGLLGSLMQDSGVAGVVASTVMPSDFADRSAGKVFGMLVDMAEAGEPVSDVVYVYQKLTAAGLLDGIGGRSGFGEIVACEAHPHNAPFYASEIKRAAALRRLTKLAARISSEASDPMANPAEIAATIEAAVQSIAHKVAGSQSVTIAQAAVDALAAVDAARHSNSRPGLPTGLWRIDETLGGLYPGELIILAARPSIGKSALGAQIAAHNAENGHPVMLGSLEMRPIDFALRSIAGDIGVTVRELRAARITEAERQAAGNFVGEIAGLPLYIWTARGATVAKIRAAAKVRQATTGLDLLILDYLGLVTATDRRKPRWEQMTEVSADLKSLALELDVPVLALCQLSREAEKGAPRLDHLRDAGAIEQDADTVLLLHRESRDSRSAILDIAKARNSATGAVTLGFDPERVRFFDDLEWHE